MWIEARLGDAQKRINRLNAFAELRSCETVLRRGNRVERFAEVNYHQVGRRTHETNESTPANRGATTFLSCAIVDLNQSRLRRFDHARE